MTDKTLTYRRVLPEIKALLDPKAGLTANLANVAAALKTAFGFLWVGFYQVAGNELTLGPFQGPVACTRIAYGKGVCGTAWLEDRVILVDHVHEFPGHIACSADARSEIVLPVHDPAGTVALVLDIDSAEPAAFDGTDEEYLTTLVVEIEKLC